MARARAGDQSLHARAADVTATDRDLRFALKPVFERG